MALVACVRALGRASLAIEGIGPDSCRKLGLLVVVNGLYGSDPPWEVWVNGVEAVAAPVAGESTFACLSGDWRSAGVRTSSARSVSAAGCWDAPRTGSDFSRSTAVAAAASRLVS